MITDRIGTSLRRTLLQSVLLALGLAPCSALRAQDLVPKAAPQTRPVVIHGATVHTVAHGTLENATVVFENGQITSVGSETETAGAIAGLEDAERIDGRGLRVVPGFVYATSVLGLAEVGSVEMTIDLREAGSIKPEVWAAVAVNPDSWLLPVARRNGVLVAGLFPQGGLVPGRVSVVQLDGWTWEDMTLEADAGLSVSWPFLGGSNPFARFGRRRGGSFGDPQESIDRLGIFFDRAEAYHEAQAAGVETEPDVRFDAVGPLLRGEKRVFVSASSRRQIESAVRWCTERGFAPVVVGGLEADRCLDLLVRHEVPVVLTGAHRLPRRRDLSFASTYELPAVLEEAGVRWSMSMSASADSASNARNLPFEVAACIGYGLPWEAALRAITLSAAEALGIGDRVGSLEVGKDATLFLCRNDPLELDSGVTAAFIQGRRIDLRDKQTELAAKYREKYRQLGILPPSNGEEVP